MERRAFLAIVQTAEDAAFDAFDRALCALPVSMLLLIVLAWYYVLFNYL